ncbi:MAG: SDR family oxidoreductase [bacterium]|nr:SDR family oxidoreductase [bacterium]
MSTKLSGKTALVTGAGKRIGREIAIALAGEGVNIVIHYRHSAAEAKRLQKELTALSVNVWLLKADFEKPQDYEKLVSRAIELTGSFDILINSASIFLPNTIQDVDYASFVQHLHVNAWVPLVLSRSFAKQVKKGHIINLLDTRINSYDFNHTAYIVSKHALAVLTRMMALEFAPNIMVNGVAPGLILPPPGKDYNYLDKLKKTVPLKKYGNPTDVAEAVIYLLKSDFITGQIINVDGGRHLLK